MIQKLLFFLALSASFGWSAPAPKIVATFLPIYAHVKSVVGDLAPIECLIGKGASPHDFSFKPSDVKKVAEADLLFANGAGIEEWLQPIIQKAGKRALRTVDLSEGISLLENPEELELKGAPHQHSHEGHDHSGKNPHTWLDPVIAQIQVKRILETLQQADPERASVYQKNAATYLVKLQDLDQAFRVQIAALPNKNLLTFHNAFPYLAARYQLNYLGSIEDFPEKAPSPKHLASLIQLIKTKEVRVLFAEEGYSPRVLQNIARETGAKIITLDTMEVGDPQPDAYLKRMRANLDALQSAWKPAKK